MADETAKLTCSEMGQIGGRARARKLTPEQRRESARRAALARWAKKVEAPDPSDPNSPNGPGRDQQGAEAGIMLSARRAPKSCRKSLSPTRKAVASIRTLFDLEGSDAA